MKQANIFNTIKTQERITAQSQQKIKQKDTLSDTEEPSRKQKVCLNECDICDFP